MSLEALALFAAGALQFYGAWSIDFAWHGRETDGRVGLPFPSKLRYVSANSWWWHAWLAMAGGVVLLFLRTAPLDSIVGQAGLICSCHRARVRLVPLAHRERRIGYGICGHLEHRLLLRGGGWERVNGARP